MSKNSVSSNLAQGDEIHGEKHEPTERRVAKMRAVLARRQPDLTLVLANIHDPHNVSAIYRSCDAFGIKNVHLYYTTTAFPALGKKSSASARKWVDSKRHRDGQRMFAELRDAGFTILSTTFSEKAAPVWECDFLRPTAIILGNEHEGVEEELTREADGEIYIPMLGMIQSLNVSVAAAVILAEAARQRTKAGFYARCRLDKTSYEADLADWLKR